MRGRIGLAMLLLAAVALVASERESYGRGHRRRGCSSCASGSCTTTCAPASGCCTVEGEKDAAPAPPAPAPSPSDAAPPAPPAAAAPAAESEAPQTVQAAPQGGTYYRAARTTRRGWLRRR